jgi:hypothetical protein
LLRALGAFALAAVLRVPSSLHAQGCVVAHGTGLPETLDQADTPHSWDFSVSYRWFQSDRHYVGITEQKQRAAAGDQVINRSNFTDLTLNYAATSRFNVEVTVPFVAHDRSQVVKNSSGVILDRFHTQATGLADISVVGNYWLFNPIFHTKGNVQFGAGLSLPTGKDNVSDTFETYDKASGKIVGVQHAVDQSIQPGSGGYGIILSLYGYRTLGAGFTGFASGQYTITPQDTNGVLTSNTGTTVMSIPDTYLLRLGVEYAVAPVQGLSLSLGLRDEGVAVYDLVGHSNGFRRPGYSMDIEPGIIYNHNRWAVRFYIPYAIQRDRLQSVPDKQKTRATGVYSQGDAAFADYEIITSVNLRF